MSLLLPRFNARQQAIEDERNIGRILEEAGPAEVPKTVSRATLPGDNRRLRGIPVVARGVAGVSPGTHPLHALLGRR
jgi:hypothetical protein